MQGLLTPFPSSRWWDLSSLSPLFSLILISFIPPKYIVSFVFFPDQSQTKEQKYLELRLIRYACNWHNYCRGTHSSVTFLGMPLGSVWRCLLLQRTTVSRQVHSLGHWGLGTQLDDSSCPGRKQRRQRRVRYQTRRETRNDQEERCGG